eukprot:scaffold82682_cov35-Tisochrysis_lutea.AAC.2
MSGKLGATASSSPHWHLSTLATPQHKKWLTLPRPPPHPSLQKCPSPGSRPPAACRAARSRHSSADTRRNERCGRVWT